MMNILALYIILRSWNDRAWGYKHFWNFWSLNAKTCHPEKPIPTPSPTMSISACFQTLTTGQKCVHSDLFISARVPHQGPVVLMWQHKADLELRMNESKEPVWVMWPHPCFNKQVVSLPVKRPGCPALSRCSVNSFFISPASSTRLRLHLSTTEPPQVWPLSPIHLAAVRHS